MRKKRKEIVLDFWDDINFLRPWPIMGCIVTKGAWKIMIFSSGEGAGSQLLSFCVFLFKILLIFEIWGKKNDRKWPKLSKSAKSV